MSAGGAVAGDVAGAAGETSTRRRIGRELWFVLLALAAAAVASWPLVLHLGPHDRLADRTLDDHVYWWDFWWIREALLVRHVDPLTCPDVFVPHGAELVASPLALPLGLLSLPLQALLGVVPGVVVAVKLFGFLLLALGAWSLSLFLRALGVPAWIALAAGCLFAFTPFRLIQLGRIHYLAGAFIPLFLHATLQVCRGRGWRWCAWAGALFAFTAACDASTVLEMALAGGALAVFEWRRGTPLRTALLRTLLCGIAGTALFAPFLVRLLAQARDNSAFDVASRLTFEDDPSVQQRILSPDLDGLAWYTAPVLHEATLMPPGERERPARLRSSARLTADIHDRFRPPVAGAAATAAAIVGGAILALALTTAALALTERGGGAWLALAVLGFLLALGPQRTFFGETIEMPYGWLARGVPGMAAGRYPAAHLRLFQLAGAVAAALGAAAVGRALWLPVATVAAAYFTVAPLRPFLFVPFTIEESHARMRDDPVPGTVLELPARHEITLRRMGFGQVVHGRRLLGGPLTRVPPVARAFFEDEPFVARCMRPADPAQLSPAQLAQEATENRALLARYGVRHVLIRRVLFEFNRESGAKLMAYLDATGLRRVPTGDGNALFVVEP
ncbi:MAG: hypothetical protein FJ293_01420 [Planctomycetes bacterium]|nr:hypothetical protein [Planctomycetota bacterium]